MLSRVEYRKSRISKKSELLALPIVSWEKNLWVTISESGRPVFLLPLGVWNIVHVCKTWRETHFVFVFSIGVILFLA